LPCRSQPCHEGIDGNWSFRIGDDTVGDINESLLTLTDFGEDRDRIQSCTDVSTRSRAALLKRASFKSR
jgi:hypothetical protein